VQFVVAQTDTIWIRDYGPRYVYQGNCRAIVGHTYNRPRPWDNRLPQAFSGFKGHAFYEHQLVHGGGNYHLNATGSSYASRLISNENGSLSDQQIIGIWQGYQNVNTTLLQPLPQSVDSTQHLDMWVQVHADNAVVVSDWPNNVGSQQDQICDQGAATFAAQGYTVTRIPARKIGSTHYTYTNVVMCNDLVLVPSYTNSTVSPLNAQALATWQQVCPNKTVVSINCQAIVTSAGVMHCIMMHVPEPIGGASPTAYVQTLNGGEVLQPGSSISIDWISDDDKGVSSSDIQLSTDGGVTFSSTIATGLPASGSYNWTVPDVCSGDARVRVVVSDADGNSGSDDSDAGFTINGSGCSAANIIYGTGKAGTLGVPSLSAANPPRIGSGWTLDLTSARPAGQATLLMGTTPLAFPFDGTNVLLLPRLLFPMTIDQGGNGISAFSIPSDSALAGVSLYWQAWILGDPMAAGLGFACSNGLESRIGF